MTKIFKIFIIIILLTVSIIGCSTDSTYFNSNEEEIQKLTLENINLKVENENLLEQLRGKEVKISNFSYEIDEIKKQYSELLKQINDNNVETIVVKVENPFSYEDLRVGYIVEGLTVTKAERYYGDVNSYMIKFAGEVTLTGTFINNPDGGYWSGIDFIVSDESFDRIPRLKNESIVKFQISNSEVAEQIIGKSKEQGRATIVFTDYQMTSIPNKPSFYSANFVRLVELYEE